MYKTESLYTRNKYNIVNQLYFNFFFKDTWLASIFFLKTHG